MNSLALKSDGTAWAWGNNASGQLGDNTTTQRTAPVQVLSLASARAIGAGESHSFAARTDGSLMAWGGNDNGKLGDGTAFYAIARGSCTETAALLDVLERRRLGSPAAIVTARRLAVRVVQMLTRVHQRLSA